MAHESQWQGACRQAAHHPVSDGAQAIADRTEVCLVHTLQAANAARSHSWG